MTPILKLRDLSKAFGGLRAVDRVSLEVRPGELSAIIGPNGAGKTTLFNLLTGEVAPDAGDVLFRGETITGWPPPRICHAGIGRSFQVASLFREFTVFENVQLAVMGGKREHRVAWRGVDRMRRQEVGDLLRELRLEELADIPAGELSHGDQKILDLAMALANDPALLLLDEPAAGLSAREAAHALSMLREVVTNRGITAVFIEHDMSMVFRYAEVVRVLHQGALLVEGPPEEIRNNADVRRVYLGDFEIA